MHAQSTAVPAGQGEPVRKLSEDDSPYTVAEIAKILRKRRATVYDWVRKGALPSTRIGNTIYIPKWALAGLLPPANGGQVAQAHRAAVPAGVAS
jgi:excisionase family DNA binding protein